MDNLVSVVVPIYNVQSYLEHCIETIVNQSYKNLEIILVDDGSTDNSGYICDEVAKKDSRIKVIHQKNKGLSGARNSGIEIATGDYISFIDSDDYISYKYVEILLEVAQRTSSEVVICDYIQGDNLLHEFNNNETYQLDYTGGAREVLGAWHGSHKDVETVAWNKLYSRRLFETGIRYPEGMYFEDVPTTHRLVECASNIAFIRNKLYYYYQRKTSIQNTLSDEKIVHKLKMQEERLLWFKENRYEAAYVRLLSKCLKYYMVTYINASSIELKQDIINRFKESYYANRVKFSICDRAIFMIYDKMYRVVDWIYCKLIKKEF